LKIKTIKIIFTAFLPATITEAEMDRQLTTLFHNISRNLDNSEEYVPIKLPRSPNYPTYTYFASKTKKVTV
jgi:hypothetical protein